MVNPSANRLAASGSWAGSSTVGSACANCFIAGYVFWRPTDVREDEVVYFCPSSSGPSGSFSRDGTRGGGVGHPQRDPAVIQLIGRMWSINPTWGSPRIRDEPVAHRQFR